MAPLDNEGWPEAAGRRFQEDQRREGKACCARLFVSGQGLARGP